MISRYGTMFATSAFETFAEINDKEEPQVRLSIYTELNDLGTREHAKSLGKPKPLSRSGKVHFNHLHYFKEYGEVRFGIITDTWFEDEQGNAIIHNTEKYRPSMIIVLITATKKLLGLLVLKYPPHQTAECRHWQTPQNNPRGSDQKAVSNLQDAVYQAGSQLSNTTMR